jgi:hypothetical protein
LFAWRQTVDDIDPVLRKLAIHPRPETGSCRRGNGNAPLLLLLHPVHGGGTIMNLPELVGDAGVIEDTLGRRRLAGVDMRHDPNVPVSLYWSATCHN